MRYTQDTFIIRANEIHNHKYDYFKVNYVNQSTPVVIVCPQHGDFERTPSYHLRGGGCPVCAKQHTLDAISKPKSEETKRKRKETMLKRYGATTFAGSEAAKKLHESGGGPWSKSSREKAAQSCIDRFGAKTWAESDIGIAMAKDRCADLDVRKEMSERAKSDITRKHYAETSMKNHGAKHWTQSDDGKLKLHELFSTDEERKARSERMRSAEVQQKMQETSMKRYGTPYYWQSDEGRVRLKKLLSNDDVQKKIIETKKLRGTLNSSKPEKTAFQLLIDKFGESDVECQYKSDDRYPFACDFYIKSLDLFIELNASWMHCYHWFDDNNPDDLKELQRLIEKADEGKPMYKRAIYIWTYDDLRKREIARKNNLNYLVFWDNDLTDFKKWLESL